MAKITKTLVVVLALAGASITFAANAAPTQRPSQAEQNWFDRASQSDGGKNAFGY